MAVRDPFAGAGASSAARSAAKALRRMPAEARKVTGAQVKEQVAQPLADAVSAAYSAGPPMASALASAVKVRVGTEPVLAVGGAKRVVSGGGQGRQLVYGVEFGSGTHPQRADRLARRATHGTTGRGSRTRGTTAQFAGQGGHYIFGTFAREAEATFGRWLAVMDPVLDAWIDGRD